jgi:predicted esterase
MVFVAKPRSILRLSALTCVFGVICMMSTGCLVYQPKGNGKMLMRNEARTGASYYLYLPEDYVKSGGHQKTGRRWPVVVSFHGMRPWDSAGAQIMEWQEEADRYGYIVIAPNTRVSDMLGGQLPIRRVSSSVKADERDTLAIIDEVMHLCDADPNHVLSTSWSMGGYLAHFMVNRHPTVFSCIAVRQSNFSADILDPAKVPDYRDMKIGIFYTKNDFAICQRESKRAIEWYKRYGFDMTSGVIDRLGHERTPETAAAFFSTTCGATPKTPPTHLATRITMTSTGRSEPQKSRSATVQPTPPAPTKTTQRPKPQPVQKRQDALPRNDALARRTTTDVPKRPVRRVAQPPIQADPQPLNVRVAQAETVAARPVDRPTAAGKKDVITVRVSAYIGISPMLISYTVQMPKKMLQDVEVLWLDNGEPISHGISGQKSLVGPGQHKIEALVVTKDRSEYRAARTVTVLDRLSFENGRK